jgi:hypothetical protein
VKPFPKQPSSGIRKIALPLNYGECNSKQNWYTAEEYLEREITAEFRSEYYFGEVFAMAGATQTHNLITGNVFALLRALARTTKCGLFLRHATGGDSGKFYAYPT